MQANLKKCIISEKSLTDIILTSISRQKDGVRLSDFYVMELDSDRQAELRKTYGVCTSGDIVESVVDAGVVIIAVEGRDKAKAIMEQIKGKVVEGALLISLASHVAISEIEKFFPNNAIVRMAVNPSIVSGSGIGAYVVGGVKSQDADSMAKMILSSKGREIPVASEDELEVVRDIIFVETVYSYLALKTFIECGIRAGVSEKQSAYIAGQVIAGAVRTVLGADEHIRKLLEQSAEQAEMLNKGKKLGQHYGFQDTMEKAIAMQ